MPQDWFAAWFDTPYYHILYKYRDDNEAQRFIDLLFEKLKPQKTDKLLDLACGRGRHAVYMNQKGYDVVGYDLADENISYAKDYENDRLHFDVRDMRQDIGENTFDWVFNLFTSFGYFQKQDDDLKAMEAISRALNTGGKLVLDFMNVHKVEQELVPNEMVKTEGITFNISRRTDDEHIIKQISFEAEGKQHTYEERVKKLAKSDFLTLFNKAGLVPLAYFGSLKLEPFDEQESDRLIMIVSKK